MFNNDLCLGFLFLNFSMALPLLVPLLVGEQQFQLIILVLQFPVNRGHRLVLLRHGLINYKDTNP